MTTTPVIGARPVAERTLTRLSARFGVVFALGQLLVMISIAVRPPARGGAG